MRKILLLAILLLSAVAAQAQEKPADNAEMSAMFEADQKAREGGLTAIDWSKVTPQDEVRRVRTTALLDSGALQTGTDFWHAAFIFQHGSTPEDYLLAHNLAVIAVARGKSDANWIAAASLDRYLQAIGRPQVFGTQYRKVDATATQEPFDRTAMSDAMREAMGVPSLAGAEERRRQFEKQWNTPVK